MEYGKDLRLDHCSSLYICFPCDKSFANMAVTSTAMQMTPSFISVKPDEVIQLSKMEACLLDIKGMDDPELSLPKL